MGRLVLIISIAFFTFAIFAQKAMTEFPTKMPSLDMVLDWNPMPDRTLQVDFEGIAFRYHILDDKPAPNCQMVVKLPHNELRWVTRPNQQAHQYLTKAEPFLYKRAGDSEWLWLSLKTYKDCPWNTVECQKTN